MRYIKVFGAILLGGGIAVLLSSFLVELTALSDDPGLGFRQISGIVAGTGSAIAGAVLLLGRQKEMILMLKVLGIILIAGGMVVLLSSALIDLVGSRNNPGFGYRQIAGIIAGSLITAVGGFMLFKVKTLAG